MSLHHLFRSRVLLSGRAAASATSAAISARLSGGGGGGGRRSRPTSRLGQTSVFYQAGLKIRELPLVVKKVNDVLQISGMDTFGDLVLAEKGARTEASSSSSSSSPSALTPDGEALETMGGFDRCFSVHGVFRLLETVPAEMVTPAVAVHVLKRIIDLENRPMAPQPKMPPANAPTTTTTTTRTTLPLLSSSPPSSSSSPALVVTATGGAKSDTFLRIAFINMLLDIVYRSKDPVAILEGLRIISRDTFPIDQDGYKERMCEETLVCVGEGVFTLPQVCEAVVIFSDFFADKKKCQECCDKLWSGIVDAADQVSAGNISSVFRTLPYLKTSRDIIHKFAADRVEEFWQEYSIRDVLEILKALTDLNSVAGGGGAESVKTLRVLSQWLKVNIHFLGEGETLAVIYCLHRLEYVDAAVVQTMERYLKVRGCQIRERDLVATLCDYCLDFRIRSRTILEGAGEYFIAHADELTAPQLFSIVRIFGELDFHPPNGFKFWELVESVLERRFSDFPPKVAIDLLLSFVYIERYPLNFVRRLFNPHFLDRLHAQQDERDVAASRAQLKLFDQAMRMEARSYGGPFLPRDRGQYYGSRAVMEVARLASSLVKPLGDVVGNETRVGKMVVLASLPFHPLYVVDLMIYPSVAASVLKFGMKTDNSQTVAVILHPAEHLTTRDGGGDGNSSRRHLIGPQAMRRRHLLAMGFRVMELDCEKVARLRVSPKQLRQHLAEKYAEAMSPEKGKPSRW